MIDTHTAHRGGVYAAALTPMHADLSVNFEGLARHCQWLIENGCAGIALLGTTGEANSLSVSERVDVLDRTLGAGILPDRLMVGTGCCALPDAILLTRHAVGRGVHDILLLPPFYYKDVSEEGLLAFCEAVIQDVGFEELNIYLYHFPKMAGVSYTDGVIEQLLERYPGTIAGIKDSSGNWTHISHLIHSFPELRVFAGSELFLLDTLEEGGAGCISASANITCRLADQVWTAWKEGSDGSVLQTTLSSARKTIQAHSMIPALKGLMARRTNRKEWGFMRPPLMLLPDEEMDVLVEELQELMASESGTALS